MSFNEIFGHEKQIAILKSVIENNRIPHAYLFYGMPGVGKHTTAGHFARALNCRQKGTDACDRCPSCLKAIHGNHPDIITVKADGQFIRIKDIRDLQERMTFKPFGGGRRIILVVDADRMNIEAANALLKTLEEPSPSNTMILLTSRPHMLPMTILSRCQHVRFNPLPAVSIASFLKERMFLDDNAANLLASSSGGSIGRAQEMNGESYIDMRNEMLIKMENILADNPVSILSFADNFGKDKSGVMKKLDILKGCYRDVLVFKETEDKRLLINQDRWETIRAVALRMNGQSVLNNMKIVEATLKAIEQNVNKALALDAMALRLGYQGNAEG